MFVRTPSWYSPINAVMYFFREIANAGFNRKTARHRNMEDLKIIVTSGGRNLDLGKRVKSLVEGMGCLLYTSDAADDP